MKKRIVRIRKINRDVFTDIRRGAKRVETRAATPKHRRVAAGDTLEFVCGGERFTKKVKRARLFKSITALLRVYSLQAVMPRMQTARELRAAHDSFPRYREKIAKYGLVAWELV